MTSRAFFTLGTGGGLTGLFWVYALVVSPFLQPHRAVESGPTKTHQHRLEPPKNQREAAEAYLSDHPWTIEAPFQVQSDRNFIYYREWEPLLEKGRVRFRPFAAVGIPEPDPNADPAEEPKTPVVIIADEAVVQFEREFDPKEPDPGRILGAAINGDVRITGPDGMDVRGRNFVYSLPAMRIWSDHPVAFKGQEHHGTAKAIQIELIQDETKSGTAPVAIAGIESVRLRKDVVLYLQAPDPEDSTKKAPVQIRAAGSFEYLMAKQLAIFEDDVRVYRPTGNNQYDSLECEHLYLQFAEKKPIAAVALPLPDGNTIANGEPTAEVIETEPGEESETAPTTSGTGLSDDLELTLMRADGGQVILTSQENSLRAEMQELIYNATGKTFTLTHSDGVKVRQEMSELVCPKIVIEQNDDNEVTHVTCTGAGRINYLDPESREHILAGRWRNWLKKSPGSLPGGQILELSGQVLMQQPTDQVALAGEYLKLWLLPTEEARRQEEIRQASGETGDGTDPSDNLRGQVRPDRLLAIRDVSIISEELQGTTNRLEVWFEPAEPATGSPTARRGNGANPNRVRPAAHATPEPEPVLITEPDDERPKDPVKLDCELLRVRVRLASRDRSDPRASRNAEMKEVWAHGRVQIDQNHTPDSPDDEVKPPLKASSDRLHIVNRSKTDQRLEFFAEQPADKNKPITPASVEDQGLRIIGPVVVLDRGQNTVHVTGQGELRLPVDRNFDGDKLKTPQPLDVVWIEEMQFDGRVAQFYGDVKGRVEGSELACQQMRIELTERIDFQESGGSRDRAQPELSRVFCKDGVQVRSDSFNESGELVERRIAYFWELTVNHVTGRSQAYGPGWITFWQKGGGNRAGLGQRADREPPKPTEEENGWEYARIDFSGLADGNIRQQFTTFNEQVQIVYGPVEKPGQAVDPDDLPTDGGWMRCQTLQVTQHDAKGETPARLELYAQGNAELEGRRFNARADTISYDEGKELYVLRSFGNRKAAIWRDRPGGGPRDQLFARRMEFIPSRNQLNFHQATGFGTGQ